MKMTNISMEWTDTGAVVSYESTIADMRIRCPRCAADVEPSAEHRCGDKAPKPARKRVKA